MCKNALISLIVYVCPSTFENYWNFQFDLSKVSNRSLNQKDTEVKNSI